MELRVHPLFFREFASKTWTSVSGIVAELVENSFDEDAMKVLITILGDGSIVVEDDVGMDEQTLEKFLLVGSPHKQEEQISPRFRRLRSGRYGTGRLSFLTAFKRMVVKTRRGGFSVALELNEGILERLALGEVELEGLDEPPLARDGVEIRLLEPKFRADPSRLVRELKRLACLRQPFFELYIKYAFLFGATEWCFEGAEQIKPPEVEGLRIPVSEPELEGEVIVSRRPLPEEERGLGVMAGGHTVARSNFGFSGVFGERITGWMRGEGLTVRFADKSALVEDESYEGFSKRVRAFLMEKVLPLMEGYVEVEITREESRVYRQVDQLLADALYNILGSVKAGEGGVGGGEIAEAVLTEVAKDEGRTGLTPSPAPEEVRERHEVLGSVDFISAPKVEDKEGARVEVLGMRGAGSPQTPAPEPTAPLREALTLEAEEHTKTSQALLSPTVQQPRPLSPAWSTGPTLTLTQPPQLRPSAPAIRPRQARRSFNLKRVGYRVIPYEDEQDEKEALAEGAVIYMNKAHPAYRAEARKGGELLLRHVMRLVSKVIALSHHPEGHEALELQNKLIAEAIRLRERK